MQCVRHACMLISSRPIICFFLYIPFYACPLMWKSNLHKLNETNKYSIGNQSLISSVLPFAFVLWLINVCSLRKNVKRPIDEWGTIHQGVKYHLWVFIADFNKKNLNLYIILALVIDILTFFNMFSTCLPKTCTC